MSRSIDERHLTAELFNVLEEVFEIHHGIFLDAGTSLFETLEGITAAEASQPVGGRCASLAAQVAHVTFYLEVIQAYLLTRDEPNADWGDIWRRVEAVDPNGWAQSKSDLESTYREVMGGLRELEDWDAPDVLGSAMAMAVHTAYHLGEIRQALCTLRT